MSIRVSDWTIHFGFDSRGLSEAAAWHEKKPLFKKVLHEHLQGHLGATTLHVLADPGHPERATLHPLMLDVEAQISVDDLRAFLNSTLDARRLGQKARVTGDPAACICLPQPNGTWRKLRGFPVDLGVLGVWVRHTLVDAVRIYETNAGITLDRHVQAELSGVGLLMVMSWPTPPMQQLAGWSGAGGHGA